MYGNFAIMPVIMVMYGNFGIMPVLTCHVWEFRYYTGSNESCMGISLIVGLLFTFIFIDKPRVKLAFKETQPIELVYFICDHGCCVIILYLE